MHGIFSTRRPFWLAVFALFIATISVAHAKEDADSQASTVWLKMSAKEKKQVQSFAEEYKQFMRIAKTELSFVAEAVNVAQAAGFKAFNNSADLSAGQRYYSINRDRTVALFVIGSKPFIDGFRVVGAHIDSPRIELKGRALYEKEGFALFQTYHHGSIKNYQWVNIPLALVGHVDKKDGSRVDISVGLDPNDPILIIPDLSPHVDQEFRERANRDVIGTEELDPIVASIPNQELSVVDAVTQYLGKQYRIETDDLVSAELALVPAMPPRDVGFDRALMAIYGQDDRLSSYAALRAVIGQQTPEFTSMAFLVDNEEVGNVNNTGANSSWLKDLMGELLYLQSEDNYNEHKLRIALRNTKVVSSDVNPAIHPTWPEVWEAGNAPRLGNGVNFKLYGGGFNANSEYIAWTRAYLDKAGIPWQTATYKGKASGGTIGKTLSKDNMEVIDYGVPVLSIHSTYAISSKVDVYLLFRAMRTFFGYSD